MSDKALQGPVEVPGPEAGPRAAIKALQANHKEAAKVAVPSVSFGIVRSEPWTSHSEQTDEERASHQAVREAIQHLEAAAV